MHNRTTAKEPKKMAQVIPLKKSVKVSFVTSGIEEMRKKDDDYLFLPICSFLVKLQPKANKIIL